MTVIKYFKYSSGICAGVFWLLSAIYSYVLITGGQASAGNMVMLVIAAIAMTLLTFIWSMLQDMAKGRK